MPCRPSDDLIYFLKHQAPVSVTFCAPPQKYPLQGQKIVLCWSGLKSLSGGGCQELEAISVNTLHKAGEREDPENGWGTCSYIGKVKIYGLKIGPSA